MKKTKTGYEHDVTHVFRHTSLSNGCRIKAFTEALNREVQKCQDKGMKDIRLKTERGLMGNVVKLIGAA